MARSVRPFGTQGHRSPPHPVPDERTSSQRIEIPLPLIRVALQEGNQASLRIAGEARNASKRLRVPSNDRPLPVISHVGQAVHLPGSRDGRTQQACRPQPTPPSHLLASPVPPVRADR